MVVLGEAMSWGGGGGGAGFYSYCFKPEGLVLSLPSGCDAYRLFHSDCMLYARPTRPTNVLKLSDHNMDIYLHS